MADRFGWNQKTRAIKSDHCGTVIVAPRDCAVGERFRLPPVADIVVAADGNGIIRTISEFKRYVPNYCSRNRPGQGVKQIKTAS